MKLIPLTQGKFAQVDDEDYEWLMKWKWYIRTNKWNSYASRNSKKNEFSKRITIQMHREIFGLKPGGKELIDHKDHDGLNNQKNNIRLATDSQNNSNIYSRKNSTSKYLGVCLDKSRKNNKKWMAQITSNKKKIHLGHYTAEPKLLSHIIRGQLNITANLLI